MGEGAALIERASRHSFLKGWRPPNSREGTAAGFAGGQAGSEIVRDLPLEVEVQLRVEAPCGQGLLPKTAKPAHDKGRAESGGRAAALHNGCQLPEAEDAAPGA